MFAIGMSQFLLSRSDGLRPVQPDDLRPPHPAVLPRLRLRVLGRRREGRLRLRGHGHDGAARQEICEENAIKYIIDPWIISDWAHNFFLKIFCQVVE